MNQPRMLSRKEVATMAFPGYTAKTASQMLSRWIARDEDLKGHLSRAGYQKGQRVLTPLMVTIFCTHFGLSPPDS